MSAPSSRRPLPALIFIGALTVLTVVVWFRVLNRSEMAAPAGPSTCPSVSKPVAAPTVLPPPHTVSVLVLNATNRNGLAAKTQKLLKKRGFTVTPVANDGPAYGGHSIINAVGQIRYGPQSELAADLLRYYLPRAAMTATDSSSKTVILSLGTKYRKLTTAAQVAYRLKHEGITLSARSTAPRPSPSPSC
ncbi:MAG: LytR C-terminal domain-containing protein [Actinomycetota bacterium]|nr:LytR C-terminal domain-containing protein [Actinomycetota bacterium]